VVETTAVTINVGDLDGAGDGGPVTVDVPRLPHLDGDGLVLARSPWVGGDDPAPIAVDWVYRPSLVRLALDFATRCRQAEAVVIWRHGGTRT
jgi:hypothetical protein